METEEEHDSIPQVLLGKEGKLGVKRNNQAGEINKLIKMKAKPLFECYADNKPVSLQNSQ